MMTLEEAIQHCREKANGSCACADDHRQLAEWLTELLERRKAEPQEGTWEEVSTCAIEDTGVDTLQQMRCSACKRWYTKPYLYNITLDNYCPNCGKKMTGDK